MELLSLESVTLRSGSRELVGGIDFRLAGGEILGIAGSNGAGKSSLVRLCSAECPPSEGHIKFRQEPLGALPSMLRAQAMAVLPQRSDLRFDFKVEQVVRLGLAPHVRQDTHGQGARNLAEALKRCELEELRHRSYPLLSGGEQQRVHLARVILQFLGVSADQSLQGKLLILDEPTAALDLRHQEMFLHWLGELRGRGAAVLLVMHDLHLLSRCADRLLLLKGGRQFALGETSSLLREDLLSELYEHPLHLVREDNRPGVFVSPGAVNASA